jgi:ABC-type Zn uptake system ZnuABC Zn-binding protein ZnuA
VATTTVLADLVAQVGGTHVRVSSLVPKGGEVHTFDPTPADVQRIVEAAIVVRNGLGLDDWLDVLVRDAGTDATVVELGEDLPETTYLEGDGGPGSVNPHVWMDASNAERYVDRIEAALAAADPAHAAAYRANADAYRSELVALDGEIRSRLAAIPAQDRVVVSFHDAFPYYARAYGLSIVGTVVDAPGQDPSAGSIADLIATMRANGVRAIFAEAQFSDSLVKAIASDTGTTLVTSLYDDSLGDPPVDSYAGLMRWDTDRVVEALTRD